LLLGVAVSACSTPSSHSAVQGEQSNVRRAPRPVSIEVSPPLTDDAHSTAIREWIDNSRRAVEAYFGRFPVETMRLELTPARRRGIGSGSARMLDVPTIRVAVHASTRPDQFAKDWTLTHEMIHLAIPALPDEQHWFEEGAATYVEPLARARAGLVAEDRVWTEIVGDYAQGLPEKNDRGLDLDSSWGRTYYGGAIFCLLADIEIRAATNNAKSLRDALVAVVESGGSIAMQDTIEHVFAIGDTATGTTVLSDLYARMKNAPEPRELASTWKSLGVSVNLGHVTYDDGAPLAHVRRELIVGPR